jgi:hypothetical protein
MRWSMKDERRLIELAKSLPVEIICIRLKRKPDSILKAALRLGVSVEV